MAESQTFGYLKSIFPLKKVFVKYLLSAILENPRIVRAGLCDGVAGECHMATQITTYHAGLGKRNAVRLIQWLLPPSSSLLFVAKSLHASLIPV